MVLCHAQTTKIQKTADFVTKYIQFRWLKNKVGCVDQNICENKIREHGIIVFMDIQTAKVQFHV